MPHWFSNVTKADSSQPLTARSLPGYLPGKAAARLCLCVISLGSALLSFSLCAQELKLRPTLQTSIAANQVLPADAAFKLQAFAEADQTVALLWEITPGYYLYRQSISINTADGSSLLLAGLPEGSHINDEYKGQVEVYYDKLLVKVPVADLGTGKELNFELGYQGCARDLYCYPPQQKAISITLP